MANTRVLELFGYSGEELLGQDVEILVPDRLRHAHYGYRQGYMQDPHNRFMGGGVELFARKKDGNEFLVEISLSYTRDHNNGPVVMALISDIRERKQLEADRAQLLEERIVELETALHALAETAKSLQSEVTASMVGESPLKESVPTIFTELIEEYEALLAEALERRVLKMEGDFQGAVDDLGDRLGFLDATPRDVVNLHRAVLQRQGKNMSSARLQGYIEEGHFLLLELLGRVASYYRDRALDHGYNGWQTKPTFKNNVEVGGSVQDDQGNHGDNRNNDDSDKQGGKRGDDNGQ
jgi:PAS domain S-box-containing protein